MKVCILIVFLFCLLGTPVLRAEVLSENKPIDQIYYLNIGRSDAATVLNKLARQTDTVLIYSYEQAKNYQANAIYGYFTLAEALDYVLLHTGLKADFNAGGIRISVTPVQTKSTNDTPAEDASVDEAEIYQQATEVIQIDGIRRSMYRAQDIKKQSDVILDAIVAEDIGKLPDITAAESLAHITGVQVSRYSDDVNGIVIRGLPYYSTTYNGREFFTAESRHASLQDFPSQALASIEVYKSTSAELIEPGLAGLINVSTHRPLDFSGKLIAGSIQSNYNDQSRKSAPIANLLYSNRWQNNLGEFGFLANATYTESNFYNGIRYASNWFVDVPSHWQISPEEFSDGGFILPGVVGLYNDGGNRWRPSLNTTIQWKPNDFLEFYFDGIFQGYRSERFTDNFFVQLTDSDWRYGDPILSNVITTENSNNRQVESVTKNGGRPPWMYRFTSESATDTYQYAVGAIFHNNGLKVETDLAITDSLYTDYQWSFDSAIHQPTRADVSFSNKTGVLFNLPDFNVKNFSEYKLRGYYESLSELEGKGIQWRTDFTYTTDSERLHTIQAGFRLVEREASRQDGLRYAWLIDLNKPLTEINFLNLKLTENPIRNSAQGFTRYIAPTRDSIANNHKKLAALAYDSLIELSERGDGWEWAAADAEAWISPELLPDPAAYFYANEKNYAAYLQAKYNFEWQGIGIDMTVGGRLLITESQSAGNSIIRSNRSNSIEKRKASNRYSNFLPNINFKVSLTDDVQARLSYAKTLTRPNFADLNPAINITQIAGGEIDAYGTSGNPDLKSIKSDSLDLALDYYFAESGYISGAAFYRDIFGFTSQQNKIIEDPVYGTIEVSRPENSGAGKIYGYEINIQSFFEFSPTVLKNLGYSANLTYFQGSNLQSTNPDEGERNYQPFTGVSKWTYNLALFYEGEKMAARLSYNHRSPWINWINEPAADGSFTGNKTRQRSRLDLSISLSLTEHLSLFSDITNILARPYRNYNQLDSNVAYPQDVRDEGRYIGVGLRFRY